MPCQGSRSMCRTCNQWLQDCRSHVRPGIVEAKRMIRRCCSCSPADLRWSAHNWCSRGGDLNCVLVVLFAHFFCFLMKLFKRAGHVAMCSTPAKISNSWYIVVARARCIDCEVIVRPVVTYHATHHATPLFWLQKK
jgi:hypothetical protein